MQLTQFNLIFTIYQFINFYYFLFIKIINIFKCKYEMCRNLGV
ncbi:hypothetical protein SAMN05421761_1314 [Belliella pelovolcani]|uniref:Uncharacterized protein n=1 Tax=Belliella pelovolcani TaxID=529505 RepID=A0A1N7Q4Z8_9BACT|nr:hypothetical protein SAMN05421761_1314 [Belliella pelovolcani]